MWEREGVAESKRGKERGEGRRRGWGEEERKRKGEGEGGEKNRGRVAAMSCVYVCECMYAARMRRDRSSEW